MHDIRFIREKPDEFDAALQRRQIAPMASSILAIDSDRRALQVQIQDMQSRRNVVSKEIGALKALGKETDTLITEVNDIKSQIPSLESKESALATALELQLLELPNTLHQSVPNGDNETQNQLIRSVGNIPEFSFIPKDHVVLGENKNFLLFLPHTQYLVQIQGICLS